MLHEVLYRLHADQLPFLARWDSAARSAAYQGHLDRVAAMLTGAVEADGLLAQLQRSYREELLPVLDDKEQVEAWIGAWGHRLIWRRDSLAFQRELRIEQLPWVVGRQVDVAADHALRSRSRTAAGYVVLPEVTLHARGRLVARQFMDATAEVAEGEQRRDATEFVAILAFGSGGDGPRGDRATFTDGVVDIHFHRPVADADTDADPAAAEATEQKAAEPELEQVKVQAPLGGFLRSLGGVLSEVIEIENNGDFHIRRSGMFVVEVPFADLLPDADSSLRRWLNEHGCVEWGRHSPNDVILLGTVTVRGADDGGLSQAYLKVHSGPITDRDRGNVPDFRNFRNGKRFFAQLAVDNQHIDPLLPLIGREPDAAVIERHRKIDTAFLDLFPTHWHSRHILHRFPKQAGYLRDDRALTEVLLDEAQRAELETLWRDFDIVADMPRRRAAAFVREVFYKSGGTYGATGGEPLPHVAEYLRSEDFDAAYPAFTEEATLRQLFAASEEVWRTRKRSPIDDAGMAVMDAFIENIIADMKQVAARREHGREVDLAWLLNLTERLWRSPLDDASRQELATFYDAQRDEGGMGHLDALRATLVRVLVSPRFLFLVEPDIDGERFYPVDAHTLAERLALLIWASVPDDQLRALADNGSLLKDSVLRGQVTRMLRDERVVGMAHEFASGWLVVRDFARAHGVDSTIYPDFDAELHRDMYLEPIYFVAECFRRDLPVDALLTADFSVLTERLADHYGVRGEDRNLRNPEAEADFGVSGWRTMSLPDERRGLTSMAAMLTMNAAGQRTSPVQRGYWVVKHLLGEHIPPPPPQVPELPRSEKDLGERSLREVLAAHRDSPSCSACHMRFDGLGLVFEHFGPLGELREHDLRGRPVDNHGEFPRGGGRGEGIEGLLAYIAEHRRNEFIEHFVREFLKYGLGRVLQATDDPLVDETSAAFAAADYKLSAVVSTLVLSPQFRCRRGLAFKGALDQ